MVKSNKLTKKNHSIIFDDKEQMLLFILGGKHDFTLQGEHASVKKGEIIDLFVRGSKKPLKQIFVIKVAMYMYTIRLYFEEMMREEDLDETTSKDA